MRRYIIIIGAMKSGTTTLFDALARHPAIAPASNKEPGFFAFDEVYAQGYDWYDTLFEYDPDKHRYRLEASSDYTKAPFVTGVWERMNEAPDVQVKLVYIMRHPLRRLESHAKHAERHRREIGRKISPRPSHSLDSGISPVSLAITCYARQLEQFEDAWASGHLHCLTLEDLKSNPVRTLATVWAFLGLDPLRGEAATVEAKNVAAKPMVHPLWRSLTSVKPLLAAGKAILPSVTRDSIRARFRQRPPKFNGRFKLTPAESALLSWVFEDDIARLNDHYGIDTARVWDLGKDLPKLGPDRRISI